MGLSLVLMAPEFTNTALLQNIKYEVNMHG